MSKILSIPKVSSPRSKPLIAWLAAAFYVLFPPNFGIGQADQPYCKLFDKRLITLDIPVLIHQAENSKRYLEAAIIGNEINILFNSENLPDDRIIEFYAEAAQISIELLEFGGYKPVLSNSFSKNSIVFNAADKDGLAASYKKLEHWLDEKVRADFRRGPKLYELNNDEISTRCMAERHSNFDDAMIHLIFAEIGTTHFQSVDCVVEELLPVFGITSDPDGYDGFVDYYFANGTEVFGSYKSFAKAIISLIREMGLTNGQDFNVTKKQYLSAKRTCEE